MKKLILILISIISLSLTSCDGFTDTRKGTISPLLSKPEQVAITDGRDIYLIPKDSTLDSIKFIYFNQKSTTKDEAFKRDYFTVYNISKSYGRYNNFYYYITLTNGDISTKLIISNDENVPHVGDKALIFYKSNVIFKTYKIQ